MLDTKIMYIDHREAIVQSLNANTKIKPTMGSLVIYKSCSLDKIMWNEMIAHRTDKG